jgi:hypothetical protein
MRMADEIDAGQARGDLQTREENLKRGSEVRHSDIGGTTLSDLGVDRRRLDEWRDVRDAGRHPSDRGVGRR